MNPDPARWTCTTCGKQVDGMVCRFCFEQRADEELFTLAVRRLAAGQAYLWLTPPPWKHLLATSHKGLTFCGDKRYSRADTTPVSLEQFRKMQQADCCIECHARVTMRLATEVKQTA